MIPLPVKPLEGGLGKAVFVVTFHVPAVDVKNVRRVGVRRRRVLKRGDAHRQTFRRQIRGVRRGNAEIISHRPTLVHLLDVNDLNVSGGLSQDITIAVRNGQVQAAGAIANPAPDEVIARPWLANEAALRTRLLPGRTRPM